MHNPELTGSSPRQRKRLITLLLGISCITSVILLVSYPAPGQQRTLQAAELDSLIRTTFDRFRIAGDRIRIQTIQADSLVRRKVYTVYVPPHFSKTRLHYELDKEVRPYGASTPAKVQFPEEDLRIHIVYRSSVVRSIQLRTDPDDNLIMD